MEMTKYLGWPEAQNWGGHMIKRVSDPAVKVTDEYVCQDCHVRGDAAVFSVGVDGCPKRPESLDYLTIRAFKGVDAMSLAEQQKAARDHWLSFAKRIGLKVDGFTERECEPTSNVIAAFIFQERMYALSFDKDKKSISAMQIGNVSRMEAAE